jgi:hypothetical protein
MAFNIPLVNLMENDIDRQFGENGTGTSIFNSKTNSRSSTCTAPIPQNSCYNINSIKDPKILHSIYNSQVTNQQLLQQQYKNMAPPSTLTNDDSSSYKANMEYDYNNIGSTNDTTNNGKSQFDNNIDKTLKYWMDNSSNIMQQFNK